VTVSIETIEHLENPRAFFRELTRITRPGGLIVVTTPNQLSLLSKLTLVVKNQFNAFQDGSYPAHRTALLEIDLRRIAAEVGLTDAQVQYTNSGRIPGMAWHWPFVGGRAFSDNVAISTRKAQT
jgi:2-polyprenyl-3-methyl-5-hydroxy-6-metoxy-1,4-benzoquinol methylase